MRNVVRLMLLWQRLEVAFAALLPLGLIIESSLANAVVYGAGDFSDHGRAAVALLRGFFFEVLTWCAAKSAKLLYDKRQWVGSGVMAVVALFAMYVSAGNNFAWVLSGHDLGGVLGSIGTLLGNGFFFHVYEFGLAILLPVSVGAIALVDLTHIVHEAIENDRLDNRAVEVVEKEMHRTAYLKGQKAQKKVIEEEYKQIAQERTQRKIEQMRTGALTFEDGSFISSASQPLLPAANQAPADELDEEDEEWWDDEEDEEEDAPGPGVVQPPSQPAAAASTPASSRATIRRLR